MGRPVGKASRRPFNRMSTYFPDTCWSLPWVTSSHSPKMSNQLPSEVPPSAGFTIMHAEVAFRHAAWPFMQQWDKDLPFLEKGLGGEFHFLPIQTEF